MSFGHKMNFDLEEEMKKISYIDASVQERIELVNEMLKEVNEMLCTALAIGRPNEEIRTKLKIVDDLIVRNSSDIVRINKMLTRIEDIDEEGEEWQQRKSF